MERVVFVLADVFRVPFPEIAATVDRSPEACRQIATRARSRVRDGGRRQHAPADAARVADDLVAALASGEVERVLALLDPDVVLVSDGGPTTHAARRPVVGATRVARLLANLGRRTRAAGVRTERAELNTGAGYIGRLGDVAVLASVIEVVDGRITRIHNVANPDKLAALGLTGPIR